MTDLAAALIAGVPRWSLVKLSEPVLMEGPFGDVVRYSDVLAALPALTTEARHDG